MHYSFGDKILYDMCQDKPTHKEKDIVAGKIWLIGRSYSASPERRLGKFKNDEAKRTRNQENRSGNNTDSDFFEKIAEIITTTLTDDSKGLDDSIEKLQNVSYKYDNSKEDFEILNKTVVLIEEFNILIKKAASKYNESKKYKREEPENNISFASKYLHFHCPSNIFIKDSYSEKNARNRKDIEKESKYKDLLSAFKKEHKEMWIIYEEKHGNMLREEYAKHALRCYLIAKELRAKVAEEDQKCLPRIVDNAIMLRE